MIKNRGGHQQDFGDEGEERRADSGFESELLGQ